MSRKRNYIPWHSLYFQLYVALGRRKGETQIQKNRIRVRLKKKKKYQCKKGQIQTISPVWLVGCNIYTVGGGGHGETRLQKNRIRVRLQQKYDLKNTSTNTNTNYLWGQDMSLGGCKEKQLGRAKMQIQIQIQISCEGYLCDWEDVRKDNWVDQKYKYKYRCIYKY